MVFLLEECGFCFDVEGVVRRHPSYFHCAEDVVKDIIRLYEGLQASIPYYNYAVLSNPDIPAYLSRLKALLRELFSQVYYSGLKLDFGRLVENYNVSPAAARFAEVGFDSTMIEIAECAREAAK
jgi:hypothetical protein